MAETLRQRYGYLPAVLVTVLEVAGEDAMLRLVAAFGGIHLVVGRRFEEDGALAEAVGLEAARAIHARLVADHILRLDVPRMTRTLEHHRRARVLSLRQDGLKIGEIALFLGVTERAVYYALADGKKARHANDRQMAQPV